MCGFMRALAPRPYAERMQASSSASSRIRAAFLPGGPLMRIKGFHHMGHSRGLQGGLEGYPCGRYGVTASVHTEQSRNQGASVALILPSPGTLFAPCRMPLRILLPRQGQAEANRMVPG